MTTANYTNQTIFSIPKDVVARKNQDGTVVLMRMDDSNVFFKIDGVAAQVWSELSEKHSIDDLISAFENKYPNNHQEIKQDIPKFIADLVSRNLLTINS